MTAVAVLLLAIAAMTTFGHATAAMGGSTLVFDQRDMGDAGGPAPAAGDDAPEPPPLSPDATTGGSQYVDLPGLAMTMAGGAVAAAGALFLHRRSRWSVPLGLAAMAVTAAVGLFPAALGVWAANFYGNGIDASVIPYLAVSGILSGAAILGAVAIWRHRRLLSPT